MNQPQHAHDAERVRVYGLMVKLCATSDDAETFLELLLDAARDPELWAAFVVAYPTVNADELTDASRWLAQRGSVSDPRRT